jgi:hypothetical protein
MLSDRTKPLGGKAYGSIPHLPGSRRGPNDYGLSDAQAAILTTRARDRRDLVIVEEKLDGGCVSAAKIDGQIVALTRAGYNATAGDFKHHHLWGQFVEDFRDRFDALLTEGERVVGEWCVMAHGTRYALPHLPFVAFDIMRGTKRAPWHDRRERVAAVDLPQPALLHAGGPLSVAAAVAMLDQGSAHGALDTVEGAVWRVERDGACDFLGKYVQPGKVDGCYLSSVTGAGDRWNTWAGWTP